jgi:hypothetical protein
MKRLLLAGALFACRPWGGHAQGVATWVEQLAALRTLEQTIQQGYTTVKNGLTQIGDIRYDEYQLHSQYYGSLATVNPAISSDAKTERLVATLNELVQRLRMELAYWQAQQPIDQP